MCARALIYLEHLKGNIKSVKNRTGEGRLICVPVKADAYGHGAIQIARASLEAGVGFLGTATVSEGKELRKEGIKAPILIFSQPHPDDIADIIRENLTPLVSDIDFTRALNEHVTTANLRFAEVLGSAAQNVKLPVHLKIDTGMRRLGCNADESLDLARFIASCQGLELTGTATHLAVSDSTEEQDIAYTKTQLEIFNKAVSSIRASGINPGIVHAANSGAVILHPDSWFDMVRPGILLYGYKTAEENKSPSDHYMNLKEYAPITVKPVMELRCAVTLIKKVKKGESVSYGRTWTAEKDTFIAVLSAGYADGLPRLASNKWQVLIGGEAFPLIGRITMDQCCANLCTDDMKTLPNIRRWDEAVIFGGQASDTHSAAALAEITGTIPYEITCNASRRAGREYLK
ncbi:MAG: alanine racemase [Treponema sp.]|nr:alanine racemase [Treponema sp.]